MVYIFDLVGVDSWGVRVVLEFIFIVVVGKGNWLFMKVFFSN